MLLMLAASLMATGEDELFRALVFGKETRLEEGHTYVVKERKPQRAPDRFFQLLSQGYRGLYVTRQHPNHVEVPRGADVRLVWLSTTLGKDYMDPHNLSSLAAAIRDFLEKAGKGVILLDGLEYLMINNEFSRIMNFMELLHEVITEHRAILLVSVDDRAFEERELALIERNAVVVG